jgi:hypothetical protein
MTRRTSPHESGQGRSSRNGSSHIGRLHKTCRFEAFGFLLRENVGIRMFSVFESVAEIVWGDSEYVRPFRRLFGSPVGAQVHTDLLFSGIPGSLLIILFENRRTVNQNSGFWLDHLIISRN